MKSCSVSPRPSRALAASVVCHMAAVAATACGAVGGEVAESPRSTPATRQRIVDPAIVPAGGAGCRTCGPGGCRHAKAAHHGHHAGCRDGVCVPYCPVRPHQFGYYGTRWRKWPGQEVLQVSGEAAAAPAQPPRSEVPGATEESLGPRAGEGPAAEPDFGRPAPDSGSPPPAPQEPAPMPALPRQPEPLPPAEQAAGPDSKPAPPPAPESDEEPQAKPERTPERKPDVVPPGPTPDAQPAPKRPEDENLFEVLSGPGWRAKRKFAVASQESAGADDAVRPAAHVGTAAARDVPPVPFDRAAETKRLRTAR